MATTSRRQPRRSKSPSDNPAGGLAALGPGSPDLEALQRELLSVLDGFEASTGLRVCVRTLVPGFRDERDRDLLPASKQFHPSPFCVLAKKNNEIACRNWDLDVLPALLRPGQAPFVRTCHAGADELLIPLFRRDALIGVVFLGQFRRTQRQPAALTRFTNDRTGHLIALGLALRSYLLEMLERCERARRETGADPAARILRYLDENAGHNPGLPELARHLSLSVSRTSHLVRERTGRSFRQLKEERLLERAKHLLETTPTKIAWVARQCGFEDANYFCRYFHRRTGHSPSAYRTRYPRPETI